MGDASGYFKTDKYLSFEEVKRKYEKAGAKMPESWPHEGGEKSDYDSICMLVLDAEGNESRTPESEDWVEITAASSNNAYDYWEDLDKAYFELEEVYEVWYDPGPIGSYILRLKTYIQWLGNRDIFEVVSVVGHSVIATDDDVLVIYDSWVE